MNKTHWFSLKSCEVMEILETHREDGLSRDQINTRIQEYGYNELEGKKGRRLWNMLIDQFKDFLIIILLSASVVSAIMGEITDSAVIVLIIILNAALGVIQESRASNALEALKEMASPDAKVIRGGDIIQVPSRELVPGDLTLIEAGNYIPADLRLIESHNLKIDEASLTGESVPVQKEAQIVFQGEIPLGDRKNLAYMGTVVTYGRGKGIVVGTGMNTEIGLIAKMLESYGEEDTPLQKKLADLGKVLGLASLAVCGIVFVLGILRGVPILEMFMTAVSLAVAAIPEGMPAIVTIVLAIGMQRMVKKNSIIKRLHAVETLGSTTIICSDKTGTLTQNEMTATQIYCNNRDYNITGEGYKPVGEFVLEGERAEPLGDVSLKLLLEIGALCNDARLEDEGIEDGGEYACRIIGDPTEGALIVAAAKACILCDDLSEVLPRLQEIPFDSARKLMTTFHSRGGNYVAYVKGAPDVMLRRSKRIFIDGDEELMTFEHRDQILKANRDMASKALRVLALGYKNVEQIPVDPHADEIETDLTFVGLIGMIDPPRPEAKEAIEVCKNAGIRPVMITGDYKDTAVAIAKELGIMDGGSKALTGADLDILNEEELIDAVKETSVYARVSPVHKLKIVDAIKKNGHIVAMTGDGVNDAPALKKADIGIAMGITGTDVAKETAEMILTDDNFASIVSAVEEGRTIYSNIRKFIFFLLSCNIAEILIIFVAMVMGLPVPLKATQLLWLNLLTDAFPALALGMEEKESDIMQSPPRKPDEPIMDTKMRQQIVIQSIFMTVAVLGVFVFALKTTGGNLEIARTYAFTALIFSELLRAYTSRSETHSIFEIGVFTNKYMVGGTFISFLLLLAVIYIPTLREIFDVTHLSSHDWCVIMGFGLLPFIAAEVSKIFLRRV